SGGKRCKSSHEQILLPRVILSATGGLYCLNITIVKSSVKAVPLNIFRLMANIENNYYDIVYERQMHKYSDSDSEEDNPWMETSSAIDRDIQGFPWANMSHNERDRNRKNRLKEYKNYQNLSWPRDQLDKECKHVDKMNTFYDFQFNTRLVQPTIVHFQGPLILNDSRKFDIRL
ncbi:hypothetical protein GIB67_038895, partial [Kingdonia uniflora]